MNINVESLKKQFGAVYEITVEHPDTGETISCIMRRPSLTELDMYTTLSASKKQISGLQTLATELYVAGDKRIVDEDYTFMRAAPLLSKMFEVKVGEIKKL